MCYNIVMKKVEFNYYDEQEFEKFLDDLPVKQLIKFTETIKNVEEHGFAIASRQRWTRKIKGQINLLEIRSKFSSNIVRAPYFHSSNGNYVVTHGFKKKSEKMPSKELEKALKRKKMYEDKYGVKK